MTVLPERGTFDLGRVLIDLFRATLADAPILVPLCLAIYVPGVVALQVLSPLAEFSRPTLEPTPGLVPGVEEILVHLGLSLLFGFAFLLFYAVVQRIGFGRLRGRPVGAGDAVGRVLRRILTVTVASVVWGICIFTGAMMCLVPGIVVLVLLFPLLAVTVNEELGPIDSFSRAWDLTLGYRWYVAAVLGIVFVPDFFLGLLLFPLAMMDSPWPYLAAWCAKSAVAEPIKAMTFAAVYVHLRRAHDNLDADDVAEVFA